MKIVIGLGWLVSCAAGLAFWLILPSPLNMLALIYAGVCLAAAIMNFGKA